MRFENGSNKVVIELQVVQFWSEIILGISNRTCAYIVYRGWQRGDRDPVSRTNFNKIHASRFE